MSHNGVDRRDQPPAPLDASTAGDIPPAAPGLSPTDEQFWKQYDNKLGSVRDFTFGVATGRTLGLYVFGSGGVGKTHSILGELESQQVPRKYYNTRMTGRGLFNELRKSPDSIFVLEDMEQLFRDPGAMGVLRSALWGPHHAEQFGPVERLITWTTNNLEHSFIFTGGLIMTGNRPFPDVPELEAVKSRIAYFELTASDREMIAMMRKISLSGFISWQGEEMEPLECQEVCEFIIEQRMALHQPLNLRDLINSFNYYLQSQECQSRGSWKGLVSHGLKKRVISNTDVKSKQERADQKQQELALALELSKVLDPRERLRRWIEATGKGRATLYRRMEQAVNKQSQSQ